MSQLISQTQAAEHFGLPRHIVPKLLAKVKPAYDNGAKTGRVVIYNLADIEPILQAEVERRKAKAAAEAPPPPPIDEEQPDNLKAQVKAVFGAVEIVRHRLEEVIKDQAEIDFRTGVIFDRTTKLIEAMEAQAKLNEADANFKRSAAAGWFSMQEVMKDTQQQIHALGVNLHQRLDTLFAEIQRLAKPTPLPLPTPNAADKPVIFSDREVPVTITTGPAFVEPKVKRRAVVLGVTDGQRQAIKQEIGDAWELDFFEGSQRYSGKFATAIDRAEFMVVMNSFRGNGPEGLAKEAGKPCYRAAGTRGIVNLLIEKL